MVNHRPPLHPPLVSSPSRALVASAPHPSGTRPLGLQRNRRLDRLGDCLVLLPLLLLLDSPLEVSHRIHGRLEGCSHGDDASRGHARGTRRPLLLVLIPKCYLPSLPSRGHQLQIQGLVHQLRPHSRQVSSVPSPPRPLGEDSVQRQREDYLVKVSDSSCPSLSLP